MIRDGQGDANDPFLEQYLGDKYAHCFCVCVREIGAHLGSSLFRLARSVQWLLYLKGKRISPDRTVSARAAITVGNLR
jgi:hypothetical protein